jgi:predicted Na+-dependent transporter
MNITRRAFFPATLARLRVFPLTVSFSEKSGAAVSSGNMVEGVSAMVVLPSALCWMLRNA